VGKVIVHATMSLDGFIARSNDEIDWAFKDGGPDQVVDEVIKTTGSVVLGKRTFEITVKQNQLPYGGAVKVPQFVVTHEARDAVTIGGLTFTFVTEGIERAVELAKIAAGDKNVSLLGASIDQQCLKLGLADEIVIHLTPILLGAGIRLFDHLGTEPIELAKTTVVSSTGITSLRFRVVT
jgi:dihydrofolate reductase